MRFYPVDGIDRGNDARRKRDLGKIKVAMEEYYNDNKCYPSGAILVSLNSQSVCNTSVPQFPGLNPWPCDPSTNMPYLVTVDSSSGCPKWFKVFAELRNKNDKDIPSNWSSSIIHVGDPSQTYSSLQVNYGVSSTNVNWYDNVVDQSCNSSICFSKFISSGQCQASDVSGCVSDGVHECYLGATGCLPQCQVSSCGLP